MPDWVFLSENKILCCKSKVRLDSVRGIALRFLSLFGDLLMMVGRANYSLYAADCAITPPEPAGRFVNRFLHPMGSGASLAGIDCVVLASSLGALTEPVKGGGEEHLSLRSSLRNHGFLQFIIDRLAQSGARRILVCVGAPASAPESPGRGCSGARPGLDCGDRRFLAAGAGLEAGVRRDPRHRRRVAGRSPGGRGSRAVAPRLTLLPQPSGAGDQGRSAGGHRLWCPAGRA